MERSLKTHKCVSLETDIAEDIKKRAQFHGFNFSDWLNNEYRAQFMSLDKKKAEIDAAKQKIKKLELEVLESEQRTQALRESFSRNESNFFKSVPRLIAEGKEWSALCNLFNLAFHKELEKPIREA